MREKSPQLDSTNWVSEHGETLYAYAVSGLKKTDAAEDAVQETLLALLRNLERLPPLGDVGPWLMGI